VNPKASDNAQFQVIDISDLDNPSLAASLTLNGSSAYNGRTIAVVGSYAYVGTDDSSGSEFYVIDISDPLNPTLEGSYDAGANVNAIAIHGDMAYLATAHDDEELVVLDVSDTANPVLETVRDMVGSNDAQDVYVNFQDNRAYLGREYDKTAGYEELGVYDATIPETPVLLQAYEYDFGITSLLAADELLFVATDQANLEFQIFDIQDPYDISYYSGLNFPQVITDLTLEDNVVYSSERSNDALRIITSQ
jgi:hypothetical protein